MEYLQILDCILLHVYKNYMISFHVETTMPRRICYQQYCFHRLQNCCKLNQRISCRAMVRIRNLTAEVETDQVYSWSWIRFRSTGFTYSLFSWLLNPLGCLGVTG